MAWVEVDGPTSTFPKEDILGFCDICRRKITRTSGQLRGVAFMGRTGVVCSDECHNKWQKSFGPKDLWDHLLEDD